MSSQSKHWIRPARYLFVLGLATLGACDLSVVNPGPMQDEFLDDPGAHSAMVAGLSYGLSRSLAIVAYVGADAAKEYTQGGRIPNPKMAVVPGQLTKDGLPATYWNESQRARWMAEDVVDRLKRVMGADYDSYLIAAQANLYAGFANRLLGENMCVAVINGGAVQPSSAHFERAEAYFTAALEIAERAGDAAIATAARAGRASVRVHLSDWAGATEDAKEVADDFKFEAVYTTMQETQHNWVYFSSANMPYRTHSVAGTFYEDYYTQTGDPRTSWSSDPNVPTAEYTAVPWYFQTKFTERDSPIRVASGREMRLIEAEALLRANDWQGAAAKLNALRTAIVSDHTGQPLDPWPITNEVEAWTALKRERGIELWLEARRLGDLRRWIAEGAPGEMEDTSDRIRLCIPVPDGEIQTNKNIPLDFVDPINPAYTGGN